MAARSSAPPSIDDELTPPSRGEDRHIVGDLITAEEISSAPPAEPEVTELTDQERADFAALITVGRRTKKITVMDHQVVIQTLKTGDEMRIGLFTKPYLETQGFSRAYQVAVCAAGIKEVDGKPLWRSLSAVEDLNEDEAFRKGVEVVEDYYPIVVSQIYQGIMDLEREFADLAIKLGKLSG
jgi:hypothetical protein